MKFDKPKIFGIISLSLSVIWLFYNTKLYYDYNFTDKLFLVMLPNWVLILNIITGGVSVIASVAILKQKIKPVISTIFIFITYLFLWAIEFYYLL